MSGGTRVRVKQRLLFVGAFTPGNDGLVGGTYTACSQLLRSPLSDAFDLVKIDLTQRDRWSRTFPGRATAGLWRVLRVLTLVLLRRIDVAVIFATLGPSWFERGLMAVICRMASLPAFLCPRCAEVNIEIEENAVVRAFTRALVHMRVQFIFQGRALKRRFLQVFPGVDDQVHIVGNWIDLSLSEHITPMKLSSHVNVLYMGWLHPMKGVDILLEGLSRHAARFKGCRFVLCGDGSKREALERVARDIELDIQFRGWVHGGDKVRAFSEADIVVLPSRVEGMPNVLLEAMAAGRPVVATAVGSVTDLVDNGVEGFVVKPLDPDAFVDALAILVEDAGLRSRFGAAGRQRIEREHSLDFAWEKLANLLTHSSSNALQSSIRSMS